LFLCALTGVLCAGPAGMAAEPALIDAEQLSFEQEGEQRVAVGNGNVVIRYEDAVLRADKVRFNMATGDAHAEGNVRLTRDGQEWVAPAADYNFKSRALQMAEVRASAGAIIVRGYDVSQTGSNQYRVARATATTCDYERPHYRVEAKRAEIWAGDRVLMYNVTVKLGEVPVFWFPVMIWSLKEDFQPLAVSVGSSSRWGFFALVTTYWRLHENARLAVHTDVRAKRGFGTGADLQYRLGPTGQGTIGGYYINDGDPRDRIDELAGKELPTDRYRAQWQHTQPDLFQRPGLDLKVDIHKQSDSDVIDDFFHGEFLGELEPQSVVDVTQRGENFSVSVLARPQLNDFFAEVERLPEATWAVNRRRLGDTPLFYEQITSVGYLDNEDGDTNDVLFSGHAWRAHTFHQLLVPATWFGWLSVTPRAGIGGTYYSDAVTDESEERPIYHAGLETAFKVSRTWDDVRCEALRIDGLRHIVQPFADYHWTPRLDSQTNELFQFDTVRTVTLGGGDLLALARYSPSTYPAYNTIDAIDRMHFVRFGLRQKLQTRRAQRTWDLAELETWTDYRLERDDAAGEDDFNDLFATLRLRPVEWFVLDSSARYDVSDGVVREFNSEARVFDTDRWSVGVGTRFIKDDSNLVSFSSAWRLGRRWVLQTHHRVDLEDGVWESQEFKLRQETHDWFISYGVRVSGERVESDEVAVFVAVTLKAFPGADLTIGRVDLGSD